MILFAMSLDLVLGYAGIVTLGHSAFFGTGAYAAGIYAAHISGEPLSGLLVAALAAGVVGWAIRSRHPAHARPDIADADARRHRTAGRGGEQGKLHHRRQPTGCKACDIDPILGLFRFDLFGHTAYLYCLAVLFLAWLFARRLVHSSFGRSLVGIRENTTRMHAIGSPVRRRLLTIYTISAALAGIAGALLAQTTQFVGLTVLGFQRSGEIVIMLVFGGIGRLYGAFFGASLYMIAQDQLAKMDPEFWYFWIGLLLVLLVMFARGGVLGLIDRLLRR